MNINYKLKPNWVTGLVDGEGCFTVRISKSESHKTGWYIQACFEIALHIKDINLLTQVKDFFYCAGTIRTRGKMAYYTVYNRKDLISTILPHFDKHPLITQKQSDFLLFRSILHIMSKNEHLHKEGVIQIVKLRASLNDGLSENLKNHFGHLIKVERPIVIRPVNIDYNWLAGFFSGEGCFFIDIFKCKTCKQGYGVSLRIIVGQHSRDRLLINSFTDILGYGYTLNCNTRNFVEFRVVKFEDIFFKVIPLFKKYEIRGVKSLDFKDFCEAAELVNNKAQHTTDGLEQIKIIKSRMNKGRCL